LINASSKYLALKPIFISSPLYSIFIKSEAFPYSGLDELSSSLFFLKIKFTPRDFSLASIDILFNVCNKSLLLITAKLSNLVGITLL